MKYSLTAYNYGKIVAEKSTDDFLSAKRFYRSHGCVRATVDGRTMRYPQSDEYFEANKFFSIGKTFKFQEADSYIFERMVKVAPNARQAIIR